MISYRMSWLNVTALPDSLPCTAGVDRSGSWYLVTTLRPEDSRITKVTSSVLAVPSVKRWRYSLMSNGLVSGSGRT